MFFKKWAWCFCQVIIKQLAESISVLRNDPLANHLTIDMLV